MSPTISIIIPVYNMERYIKKCIDSVVNQTGIDSYKSRIEVLLIDDGSTDSSLNIINEYAEKHSYIRVIAKVNEGVSKARNIGIESTKCKYIWFIDSDDWIAKDSFETIFNELDNNEIDILEFDFTKAFDDVNNSIIYKVEPYYSKIETDIISGDEFMSQYGFIISVTSKVIRRTLFTDNNIWFPLNRKAEDYIPPLMLMANSKNYKKISHSLYCYYSRQGSATTNKDKNHIIQHHNDIIINIEETLDFITANDNQAVNSKLYDMISFLEANIIYSIFTNRLGRRHLDSIINRLRLLKVFPIRKYSYYNIGKKRSLFRLLTNNKATLCVAKYLFFPTK